MWSSGDVTCIDSKVFADKHIIWNTLHWFKFCNRCNRCKLWVTPSCLIVTEWTLAVWKSLGKAWTALLIFTGLTWYLAGWFEQRSRKVLVLKCISQDTTAWWTIPLKDQITGFLPAPNKPKLENDKRKICSRCFCIERCTNKMLYHHRAYNAVMKPLWKYATLRLFIDTPLTAIARQANPTLGL